MKEQLTMWRLSPYLPYKLSMGYYETWSPNFIEIEPKLTLFIGELIELSQETNNAEVWVNDGRRNFRVTSRLNSFKPILRPLSDLTKEIEHEGEKFDVEEMLNDMWGGCETFYSFKGVELSEDTYTTPDAKHQKKVYPNTRCYPYYIFETLLKWHFDVFGLIEKGLAIDINTLKTF